MDRYSRIIAVLKVAFPLSALAILSVLFFLSQGSDYTARIPFAEDEIAEMTRSQRVSEPVHATMTAKGHEILIRAATASPGQPDTPAAADQILADIIFADGNTAQMVADRSQEADTAGMIRFIDNVRLTSSLGYRLSTDLVDTATDHINLIAPGPLNGETPMGEIAAGSLEMRAKNGNGPVHMLFTRGVKLVYDPKLTERP